MNVFKNILFLIGLVSGTFLFGQTSSLRAYMDNKQFFAPETGNYIEIYFQFVGSSVKYHGVEGGLQGEVALYLSVFDGTDIVASDAYRLETPVMKDSIVEDFYDVKRFALNPGRYTLSIELLDINSDDAAVKVTHPIIIEDFSDAISISDLEIVEYAVKGDENSPFFKSGYEMIPRLSTFYPSVLTSIPVYFELYNTHLLEDSLCGLKQYIINMETGVEVPEFGLFTRHSTSEVLPVLRNVDISKLPTGKYALNYTLISSRLTELATETYLFERSNDLEISWNMDNLILDPAFQASITNDSVSFFLESLIPISKPAEIKNIIASLKSSDLEKQRKHIQAFWLKTAPTSAYSAWINYKAQVLLVEKLYSNNFQAGFETDRGRVYLQYGSPTNIVIKDVSPSEYPYEIWQYNKIGAFSNKRFIFYNPDLVNNTHRLLHSDMVGELKNPSWPQILAKRNTTNGNIDNPNDDTQKHYGGNSNDLFRQY